MRLQSKDLLMGKKRDFCSSKRRKLEARRILKEALLASDEEFLEEVLEPLDLNRSSMNHIHMSEPNILFSAIHRFFRSKEGLDFSEVYTDFRKRIRPKHYFLLNYVNIKELLPGERHHWFPYLEDGKIVCPQKKGNGEQGRLDYLSTAELSTIFHKFRVVQNRTVEAFFLLYHSGAWRSYTTIFHRYDSSYGYTQFLPITTPYKDGGRMFNHYMPKAPQLLEHQTPIEGIQDHRFLWLLGRKAVAFAKANGLVG